MIFDSLMQTFVIIFFKSSKFIVNFSSSCTSYSVNIFGYISNNITATFGGSNDDKNIPSLFALNVLSDKKLTNCW